MTPRYCRDVQHQRATAAVIDMTTPTPTLLGSACVIVVGDRLSISERCAYPAIPPPTVRHVSASPVQAAFPYHQFVSIFDYDDQIPAAQPYQVDLVDNIEYSDPIDVIPDDEEDVAMIRRIVESHDMDSDMQSLQWIVDSWS